jgi:hypothetical protein
LVLMKQNVEYLAIKFLTELAVNHRHNMQHPSDSMSTERATAKPCAGGPSHRNPVVGPEEGPHTCADILGLGWRRRDEAAGGNPGGGEVGPGRRKQRTVTDRQPRSHPAPFCRPLIIVVSSSPAGRSNVA